MVHDEHTLIHAAKHGSRTACNVLYNRHVDPLFRFLRQFSENSQQVEDLVQRAFIKAFTNIESFNENARFSTWLFTIALNELRTDKRRQPLVFIDPTELYEINEESTNDFEWQDAMKVLLKDLKPIKRAVFLLYEVEGYSHIEIGSILGITENLSRTLLHRTKNILRTKWELLKDAI